jgi:hypothetical protein
VWNLGTAQAGRAINVVPDVAVAGVHQYLNLAHHILDRTQGPDYAI